MRSNLDECDDWYNATAMEEVMNRNYFERPIQGSRSTHDYGRSGPIEPLLSDEPSGALLWIVGAFVGAIVGIPVLWAFGF